jgi:PhzF family phenazine biosynthesis protein
MKSFACFQVDAFTDRPFAGNPACVCPLESWPGDELLQKVARENATPATAFFAPRGEELELRWFSPTREIALCGHGTLAAAFVLMNELDPGRERAVFQTGKGALEVQRNHDGYALDMPRLEARSAPVPAGLGEALGVASPRQTLDGEGRVVIVVDEARAVRALRPDFTRLLGLSDFGAALVTAPGTDRDADVDFVSRYFAPHHGVPEDPVTGSAHCLLAPYWSRRLGKPKLRARQVSERGGELACEIRGERVRLTGHAVLVKRGVFVDS